ncbi:PP2C family protein-serine/threonine phosphatase [Streptomyces sp. NPDC056948]|uniref:PP2C family protein-serine/threonine phosphatase n=1 Tax=Streptomyces sp. NPDC056948 TaxID=3345975 RepID=UPI0036421F1A
MAASQDGDGRLEEYLADPGNRALDLTTAAARATEALGLQHSAVYLADIQQRRLVPLTDVASPLLVDDSLAGWTYRTQSLRVEESESGGMTAWVPLVDGAERLGVLAVHSASLTPAVLRRGKALATLLAMMITSTRAYQDSFVRLTRTRPMLLPAEMLRAFLPPRTIGTAHVVSTAVLEPAYELGGDAFDHSLTETALHATVLDAMGHNLASGLTTAVCLAASRNARRTGADLPDLVQSVDDALAQWLPDQFCTGVLAQLDLVSGVLRWCNCGHPTPLLIRDRRPDVDAMRREPEPPMGLPSRLAGLKRRTHEIALKPGDRVLMYSDGVTEARAVDGAEFGLEQFADYIIRATAAGELAPETLRRLIHSILDSSGSRLRDDATILMFEWSPPAR